MCRSVTRYWFLLILLLALVLRVPQLDFQPLWWDEGYSVFFATRDFPTMLARTAIDIHPPLYYALMQVWMLAFGTNVVALRLLSVIIGVASVPLIYLVSKTLFDLRTALVAAFLLAIAPLHIYYSQEVRMYGLAMLLALAAVWFQLRVLMDDGAKSPVASRQSPVGGLGQVIPFPLSCDDLPRSAVVFYVIVTALLLYTLYYGVFLIMAEIAVVLYLKFRARWRIALRRWILLWIAVGVLYLPWVIYAGLKLYIYVVNKVGIEQYSRLDPITYLVQHLAAFSLGHVTDWTWLAWGTILFVALAVFGYVMGRRWNIASPEAIIHTERYALTLLYLFVPLVGGFAVNFLAPFHPVRYERSLLFAAPFFLILVAQGLVALFERQRVIAFAASAALVVLCELSLYDFYTVERYPGEDYRALIHDMENIAAPGDLVYAFYPWQIGYLAAYYHGAPLNIYEVPGNEWIQNEGVMGAALEHLRAQNPRAWILAYQKQGHVLESRVTNEYINDYLVFDEVYGNTVAEYFAQGNPTDRERAPVSFSPELTLRIQSAGFLVTPDEPPLALARFTWNAQNDDYSYSLRVENAEGKVAQQDGEIPTGTTTLRRGLALPRNLPPGEYTLRLIAYRRADGRPLELPDGSTGVTLAKITTE